MHIPNAPLMMGHMLTLLSLLYTTQFHCCSTSGCGKNVPGRDPHSQRFQCLSPAHNMNVCGPCLTSAPNAQQCRAMRLFFGGI